MRYLDGHATASADCEALTRRPRHYINAIYQRRVHGALDGACPQNRFYEGPVALRFPATHRLHQALFIETRRKVSADDVVSINGDIYEVPPGYAGQRHVFARHAVDGTVHMIHENKTIMLCPVDLYRNARRLGGTAVVPDTGTVQALPDGSVYTQFTTDFRPLADQGGNCFEPKEDSDEQHS